MQPRARDSEPTTRLLRRARATPRDGFAALHQRMAPPLRLWAELHILPPLRATMSPDDLVQEVWARAFAGFGGYDHTRTDFRAWLFGIAYNVLREQLRSWRARASHHAGAEPRDAPDTADPRTSVGAAAARAEQSRLLFDHAATLPAEDRHLLVWRGLEALSFAEIGARLGISAVAADSRWRRLCHQLRRTFPEWLET